MMKQLDITTRRLLLRSFTLADVADVQRLAGNFNVAKMTINVPHPYEDGMAEQWISTHADGWNSRTRITHAITDKQSGQLLGCISLFNITEGQCKLGYWLGESEWGKGYCTEAAIAIIQFAFEHLQLDKVAAVHLTVNPASGRVMEKAGMQHVGVIQDANRDGETCQLECYEIRR